MAINSEFVQVYATLGYSFCSFNYRGFNRSRGWPAAANVAHDAALVLDFLRNHLGFKRVGVHGRSIGGICAVQLGSRSDVAQLDFVVADRTFSKLSLAAKAMLGTWAQISVVALQEDSPDLGKLWLNVKCPKIVIHAEDDEIIRPSASLVTGIAKNIAPSKFAKTELEKIANLLNALVFNAVNIEARLIGHSYDLTEETRELRDGLIDLFGLPDGDRFAGSDIENFSAKIQVWSSPEEALELLRSMSEILVKSDQPEANILKNLFVDRMSLGAVVDRKITGLLVRTDSGHNDNLSVTEKATLVEIIRAATKENI
jgi:hypothetical protein